MPAQCAEGTQVVGPVLYGAIGGLGLIVAILGLAVKMNFQRTKWRREDISELGGKIDNLGDRMDGVASELRGEISTLCDHTDTRLDTLRNHMDTRLDRIADRRAGETPAE